jgi:hypothetical protein
MPFSASRRADHENGDPGASGGRDEIAAGKAVVRHSSRSEAGTNSFPYELRAHFVERLIPDF